MPGPPQQPSLYDTYVQPALSGLRRAADSVGQAVGLSAPAPDPSAMDAVKRAALQGRVQRAYDNVAKGMPDVQPVTLTAGQGNAPTGKPAIASVNMFRGDNISYDPAQVDQLSDPELEETLTHEMTHVREAQQTPLLQRVYNAYFAKHDVPAEVKGTVLDDPYYWNPVEQRAFQAEREKMGASGRGLQRDPMTGAYDIYLPPEGAFADALRKRR